MSCVLSQNFGHVPRGADIEKTFTQIGTSASTAGWTFLLTFTDSETGATLFSTTAITHAGTVLTSAIARTQSDLLTNRYNFGLVKTNAGGAEPLAAGYGTSFSVPGL